MSKLKIIMRFKESVLVEADTSNIFILKQNIFLAPALQLFQAYFIWTWLLKIFLSLWQIGRLFFFEPT